MSQSPSTADESDQVDNYLKGWSSLSDMLRRGGSLSGREANCCYLNLGPGRQPRFADVSAVSGFDFLDDGRAMGLIDWDVDGDLDLWVTNRTGPRLRVIRNNTDGHNRYLALKLQGVSCNRDAIGARVEIVVDSAAGAKMTRVVRAGDSYLTQSSKWLHFGLGSAQSIDRVRIFWPGGSSFEEVNGIDVNGRYRIVQGESVARRVERPETSVSSETRSIASESVQPLPQRVLVVGRWPFPPIKVQTADGEDETLYDQPGRPLLINFWASWCTPCLAELADWTKRREEIDAAGLNVVALCARRPDQSASQQSAEARAVMDQLAFPYRWRWVDEQVIATANAVLAMTCSDYQRPFGVPSSILLDRYGQVAAIYRGAVDLDVVLRDAKLLDATPEQVRAAATPFAGSWMHEPARPSPQRFASMLERDGKSDEAERYWRHVLWLAESTDGGPYAISDRWRGDAAFALGGSLLRSGRVAESIDFNRQAIELRPDDFRPRANLGASLLKLGDAAGAIEQFNAALALRPDRASVLTNRATARQQLGQMELAIADWEATLKLDPKDVTARGRIAAASLAIGDDARAIRHYQLLLEQESDSIDIIGVLAWLMATSPLSEVRDGAAATRYAQQWVDATGGRDAKALNALAAAQAESGDFEAAVDTMSAALGICRQQNNLAMLRAYTPRLELYRQRKPYHRPSVPEQRPASPSAR